MGHYKSNVRDLEFNLFEVFGRDEVLGAAPYDEVDSDTAREMIREMARLAENELASSFDDSDRNPPVYDPARTDVQIPESFKKSYQSYVDAGFWAVDVPGDLGGTVAPPVAEVGDERASARRQPGGGHLRRVLLVRQTALSARQR